MNQRQQNLEAAVLVGLLVSPLLLHIPTERRNMAFRTDTSLILLEARTDTSLILIEATVPKLRKKRATFEPWHISRVPQEELAKDAMESMENMESRLMGRVQILRENFTGMAHTGGDARTVILLTTIMTTQKSRLRMNGFAGVLLLLSRLLSRLLATILRATPKLC
jgi:hypothetical protein